MNNKLILLRGSLLGCLLYASSFVLAQPITTIDAGNLHQFLDEMDLYFGDIMQVSEAQLSQFVNTFVAAGTSGSCPAPVPIEESLEDAQVSFSWEGGSSIGYRVGYLDLRTGASATAVVNHADYTFHLPNGLYAFAFQQNCGTAKSNLTIIIYDKVVGLMADNRLSCKCKHTQIFTDDLQGIEVTEFDEFDIWIGYEASPVQANQIHFKRACLDCDDYIFNSNCVGGGLEVLNNIYYSQDEADNSLATICLTGNDLGLALNLASGITATLGICQEEPRTNQHGAPLIQVYPSGPQLYRVEKMTGPSPGRSHLLLFNQSGQVLRQWSFEEATTEMVQDVDLSPYPVGMYFLRIGDAKGSWVEKLIRS